MADPKIVYDILARAEGGSDVEALARALEQVDKAIDPAAAARAQKLADELRELGAQKSAIEEFARLKTATQEAAKALETAQAAAQEAGKALAASEAPTKAEAGAFQKLSDAVKAAKADLLAQTEALGAARTNLGELGVSTEALAAHQASLKTALAGTVKEVQALGQQGQAVARFQELGTAVSKARADIAASDAALREFRQSLSATEAPTAAQAAKLVQLADASRQARAAFQAQLQAQTQAGATLRALGVDTDALAASQRRVVQSAGAQTTALREAAAETDVLGKGLKALAGIGVAGILGNQAVQLTKQVSDTADAYQNLETRVKLAAGAGGDFRATFNEVQQVAIRTSSSLESTGELFSRIARAGKEIGLSNREALALTETINQAIQLSGSSAQASDAAITQLIQGLQSGTLRGEELNSVLEQAPRLAQALADGFGTTTGKLKELGEAGQLTAARVIEALKGQAKTLQAEFDQLPQTVGRALENLTTAWTRYIGEASQANGITATAASLINGLAGNLDTAGTVVLSLTKAVIAYKAVRLAESFFETGVAAKGAQVAIAGKTVAVVADTTATAANTVAQRANAAATAEAGASAGKFAGLIGGLKLFGLVAVLSNFREIGTAIGEGVAKLLGYDKSLKLLEATQKADAAASRDAAQARADLAQKTQQASDKALGLDDVSRKLVGDFEELQKKGASAGEAIGKLAKELDLGSIKGIERAVAALDVLREKGTLTGQQVRDALAEGLSGKDLLVFQTTARAAFDGTEQGARRLKSVLDAIGDESLRRVGTSAAEIETGFNKASRSAINDLDQLTKTIVGLGVKSDETGRALGAGVNKALEAATTERAVKAVIERIEELGKKGLLTGDQVADALLKAKTKADDLGIGINSLSEAARKAGFDVGTLTTGVSKGFDDGVKAVRDLREQIEKAGISAERASPILAKAFDQRITAAATKEELKLLRAEIEKAIASGLLLGTTGTAALEKIRAKTAELTPAFQQAQRDAERLGIVLKDNIAAGAAGGVEGALTAYERLKAGGKASQDEIQQGFARTAQEAIRAAGGIVPEFIKVEAAARGVVVEVDNSGRAFTRLAQAGEFAGQVINRELDRATAAAVRLIDHLVSVEQARNASVKSVLGSSSDFTDGSGKVTGNIGSSVFNGQVNIPAGSYFDKASFDREQAFGRNPDPTRFVKPIEGTSGSLVKGGTAGGSGVSDGAAATLKQIADNLAAKFGGAGSLHTVEVKTPSGAQRIGVASQADGAALAGLIGQLGQSARSSGATV